MKMKYYVRGLGIGFVISSLIFIMAFSFYKPGYSKDEIKKMAVSPIFFYFLSYDPAATDSGAA